MNRENLKLLADYLLKLPEDYCHFDMGNWHGDYDYPAAAYLEGITNCNTTGCAVGHAPYVQGLSNPYFPESWFEYSERIFGMVEGSDEWSWCFASDWTDSDNTPHGAAKRILWLLEHGLPDDWSDQMYSITPLCYN